MYCNFLLRVQVGCGYLGCVLRHLADYSDIKLIETFESVIDQLKFSEWKVGLCKLHCMLLGLLQARAEGALSFLSVHVNSP